MRRFLALLFLLPILAFAAPASAASTDGNHVTRWDATYDLQPDGSARVTVEIDFDFGNDPGHGPYFTFPIRQGYDESQLREYPITDITASSPTGAPANVYLDEGEDWITVRIGDQDVDNVSGNQTYILSYSVGHVMNAVTGISLEGETEPVDGDEFYWNAVGDGWTIPIADLTVSVTSPADVVAMQCFVGFYGVDEACGSMDAEGARVTFTQDALSPGQQFTIDVLYPPGTFDTTPQLVPANDIARALAPHPAVLALAALMLVGGLAFVWFRLDRATKDEYYVGVTPGVTPGLEVADGPRTVWRRKAPPVAVQFEPPAGLRPGLLGTLWDEKAEARDATATIVDLAVRGYLRIDKTGDKDFTLVKLRDLDADAEAYERTLFDGIFAGGSSTSLDDLRTTFSATLAAATGEMYDATVERGWYAHSPAATRSVWGFLGVLFTVLGVVVLLFFRDGPGTVWLSVPLIVVGVTLLVTVRAAPIRRAEGSRVLAQTSGFELYLRTADANQLRLEEGEDIFSKYLPYAIAFGIADQWTERFEKLAAEGYDVGEPTWFTGYSVGAFWLASQGFSSSINEFASLTSAAVAAPTPSSSGSSGFSGGGGGGFSGGGGGGGGGGGW